MPPELRLHPSWARRGGAAPGGSELCCLVPLERHCAAHRLELVCSSASSITLALRRLAAQCRLAMRRQSSNATRGTSGWKIRGDGLVGLGSLAALGSRDAGRLNIPSQHRCLRVAAWVPAGFPGLCDDWFGRLTRSAITGRLPRSVLVGPDIDGQAESSAEFLAAYCACRSLRKRRRGMGCASEWQAEWRGSSSAMGQFRGRRGSVHLTLGEQPTRLPILRGESPLSVNCPVLDG